MNNLLPEFVAGLHFPKSLVQAFTANQWQELKSQ